MVRGDRRPEPSRRRLHRRAVPALVLVLIASAVTICVLFVTSSPRADRNTPRETESPSNQIEDQVLLPVAEPVRTEQDIVALKKKEMELAEELVQEFPDSDESLTVMGNLCYRHGNAAEAVKLWTKALEINPKRANLYMSIGNVSLKKGEFAEAVTQYRKAVEIQPRLPDAHGNMGLALKMSGRLPEAIDALQEEIKISPDSGFAYYLLGQIYQQQEEYEKATQSYEAAIKIEPEYANAYYGLATIRAKLGDTDQAKEYSAKFKDLKAEARKDAMDRRMQYDDAYNAQQNAAITYINVGRMYRDSGKLQKAETLLKQAAGLDPNNVVSFLELASLYQAQKQQAKALQMFKKIAEIEPDSAISFVMIGILSAHFKQFDDAEQAFRKVIALAPRSPDGYRELARLYLKTGRELPQARQLAQKAVALEASAANYFVLGWAYHSNGDATNALPAVKRAIELDPGNANYRRLHAAIRGGN